MLPDCLISERHLLSSHLQDFDGLYLYLISSSSSRLLASTQRPDQSQTSRSRNAYEAIYSARDAPAITSVIPRPQATWVGTQPRRRPKTPTSRPSRAAGNETGTSGSSSSSASPWASLLSQSLLIWCITFASGRGRSAGLRTPTTRSSRGRMRKARAGWL